MTINPDNSQTTLGQYRELDPRPWTIHRNRSGTPRWYQRWLEAWWIVTGYWSLHRAWQAGHDNGTREEYRRLITNGAWKAETSSYRIVQRGEAL